MKLALLALLVPLTASADNDIDRRWRLEGAVGLRVGSFFINNETAAADDGDKSTDTIGGHFAIGMRKARWLIYGDYELLGISEHTAAVAERGDGGAGFGSGLAHRVGANARRAFARMADHEMSIEGYVEGGLGVQHIRWDDGGYWTRPDVSFGFGFSMWAAEDNSHLAMSLGLRVLLAKRGDVGDDAPTACGGPCDAATGPTTFDRSIMFDVTIAVGR